MKKCMLAVVALLFLGDCFAQIQPQKAILISPTSANTKTLIIKNKGLAKLTPSPIKQPPAPDYKNATLVSAYVTVITGVTNAGYNKDDNKDGDTHWSCGTFNQSGADITSFHDNSDHDEYVVGSRKMLQMQLDKTAIMGDFESLGRLHINIAPNGNDTWKIYQFTLTMNFDNPRSQQNINWEDIVLTQDQRDADLYFYFNGKNLVLK